MKPWEKKLQTLTTKELYQALSKIYINHLSDENFQKKYTATRTEMRLAITNILKKQYPKRKDIEKNIEKNIEIEKEKIKQDAYNTFTISDDEFSKEMGGD